MMKTSNRFALFAITCIATFLLIASCESRADYTNKWQPLYDPVARIYKNNSNVNYIHNNNTHFQGWEVKVYIKRALEAWRNVCNIPLEWDGYTTVINMDVGNTIRWEPIFGNISAYVVGQAEYNSVKGRWEIVQTEMVLDPDKIQTPQFLYQLLVHELGHVLGLNHSQYNNTVMSGPPFSQYNNLSELTDDDILGCNNLYQ